MYSFHRPIATAPFVLYGHENPRQRLRALNRIAQTVVRNGSSLCEFVGLSSGACSVGSQQETAALVTRESAGALCEAWLYRPVTAPALTLVADCDQVPLSTLLTFLRSSRRAGLQVIWGWHPSRMDPAVLQQSGLICGDILRRRGWQAPTATWTLEPVRE